MAAPRLWVGEGALRDKVLPHLRTLLRPFNPTPWASGNHAQTFLGCEYAALEQYLRGGQLSACTPSTGPHNPNGTSSKAFLAGTDNIPAYKHCNLYITCYAAATTASPLSSCHRTDLVPGPMDLQCCAR